MTESKICTCPSGDGSLRWPCPKHPAVEQAGTNVGHGHVFPRADGVKMRCGGPGLCSECAADASRARAALAQPSPASDLDPLNLAPHAEAFNEAPAEALKPGQAEAERPEVVAVMESNGAGGKRLAQRFPIVNVFVGDELMTVAQHERITGQLHDALDESDGDRWKLRSERDAALARVAEMEKQEPVALANRGLHAFWVKWTDAAAGLYGPGIKLYAAPVAQAVQVPQAWLDVQAERRRQITAEGWTPEHDDEHACDEIAAFACFYAMPPAARDWDASSTGYGDTLGEAIVPEGWEPKTGDRRRELVKAGGLILAEIERLDRAAAHGKEGL